MEEHGSERTYEEIGQDLLNATAKYIRELHLLQDVFRSEIIKLGAIQRNLNTIFFSIRDVYRLAVRIWEKLDNLMEAAKLPMPLIDNSFYEDIEKSLKNNVLKNYAIHVMSSAVENTLSYLLPEDRASSIANDMRLAIRYLLPSFFQNSVQYWRYCAESMRLLGEVSRSQHDKIKLANIQLLLQTELAGIPIESASENSRFFVSYTVPLPEPSSKLEKVRELQAKVLNWKDTIGRHNRNWNQFIRDGVFTMDIQGRATFEVLVIFFNTNVYVCKQINTLPCTGRPKGWLVKRRWLIEDMNIFDYINEERLKDAFSIQLTGKTFTLHTGSFKIKKLWLADLVKLQTEPMLTVKLNEVLATKERIYALQIPFQGYKFNKPDSTENIIYALGASHLIEGATLTKLVEKVTSPYSSSKLQHTFLLTYRRFCTPADLFDLLIERFKMPKTYPYVRTEAEPNYDDISRKYFELSSAKLYLHKIHNPIQIRVLNLLKRWIEFFFEDFQDTVDLLTKLNRFVEFLLKENVENVGGVCRILRRKVFLQKTLQVSKLQRPISTPPIEWYCQVENADYSILTLHPVEIARQMTLVQHGIYCTIKAREIVDKEWLESETNITSSNLVRFLRFNDMVTYWLQRNIVEAQTLEERKAVLCRILEIMAILEELNNFNAFVAFSDALESNSIRRLTSTFEGLPKPQTKVLKSIRIEDFKEICHRKMRSVKPPCIPYIEIYLRNVHILEKQADVLPYTSLLNFKKMRGIADIVSEVLQYQNSYYTYEAEESIQTTQAPVIRITSPTRLRASPCLQRWLQQCCDFWLCQVAVQLKRLLSFPMSKVA